MRGDLYSGMKQYGLNKKEALLTYDFFGGKKKAAFAAPVFLGSIT